LPSRAVRAAAPRCRDAERAGRQPAAWPLDDQGRPCEAPHHGCIRMPFSNRVSVVNVLLRVAIAFAGSRFSTRSAYAAATSGPKRRRCNVHNELACNARGSTASLAASLHPRPGGQLTLAPESRSSESSVDRLRSVGGALPFRSRYNRPNVIGMRRDCTRKQRDDDQDRNCSVGEARCPPSH
jgi:hypothetical protein